VLGIAPGVWLFEVHAAGYLPETVVLPNRLLTASSPNAAGQMLLWELVLKPVPVPEDPRYTDMTAAAAAARDGRAAEAEALLQRVPEDADADFLAGAARVALVARRQDLARTLFMRALQLDRKSVGE